jgi:hypothetical protein
MVCVASLLTGCTVVHTPPADGSPPDGPAPATATAAPTGAPTATATTTTPPAALKGGWSVRLTSENPKTPPAADTPEAKAKVFFDHTASVVDGAVVVRHGLIGREWRAGDPLGQELDQLMTSTDWKKMKLRTSLEEAIPSGTIHHFVVTLGTEKLEFATGNLKGYPELTKIADSLRSLSGMP